MSADLQTALAGWVSRIGWPVNERMRAELSARYGVSGASDLQTLLSRFIGEGAAAISAASGGTGAPSYASTVLADGATHHWKLNETGGTSAVDAIGGTNGTISGGVTLGAASVLAANLGTAMTFDGTSGKIVTPPIVLTTPFTIEFWARRNANTASQVLFAYWSGVGDNIALFVEPNIFAAYTGSQGSPSITWPYDTNWHHCVCVCASGAPGKLYVDGVTYPSDVTPITFAAGTAKALGFAFDPNWNYYNGSLDDVAIYPTALTPTKITNHYRLGLGSYQARVVADGVSHSWRLNETTGTTVAATNGGVNGTISGGVTLGVASASAANLGTAMTFDGSGRITMASLITLPVTATIEVWVKTSNMAYAGAFGSQHTSGAARIAGINSVGYAMLYLVPEAIQLNGGVRLVSDNTWHHVVYLYSPSSCSIYVDGVFDVSVASGVTSGSLDVTAFIGGDSAAGPYPWIGSIDEVAIYPLALSPSQILAHYQLGVG